MTEPSPEAQLDGGRGSAFSGGQGLTAEAQSLRDRFGDRRFHTVEIR
jgi:hypothetical protein